MNLYFYYRSSFSSKLEIGAINKKFPALPGLIVCSNFVARPGITCSDSWEEGFTIKLQIHSFTGFFFFCAQTSKQALLFVPS